MCNHKYMHTHTHNSHKKNYNSHFVNFNYGSVSKSVNFLVPILFSYIMTSCQKTKKKKNSSSLASVGMLQIGRNDLMIQPFQQNNTKKNIKTWMRLLSMGRNV